MKERPIKYFQGDNFVSSLKLLIQKGGKYQKAGERVHQAWSKAQMGGHSHAEVFAGLTVTNHGESRIENCVKYDLTGFARLVTAFSNDLCIFLYAGDHDEVGKWLDSNKGMSFVAKPQGQAIGIDTVLISNTKNGEQGWIRSEMDWMSSGPIINLLPENYQNKLFSGLEAKIVDAVKLIESDTKEDDILQIVSLIKDTEHSDALLDVLLSLRSSDRVNAVLRIDLFENEAIPIKALEPSQTENIISTETVVRLTDIDPVLFEHFIKTADFKQWMLYLHPDQRSIVTRDFPGPTRLAGVSGSGKTCVVIHRAVRLAQLFPDKSVLVLTLNEALAKLIRELITAECGPALPSNIQVQSIFELCRSKLIELNPKKEKHYAKKTAQTNAFSVSEHIDDIWDEYYHRDNNNSDANILLEVEKTLLARGIYPQDYIRQELDYIRSAFAPSERNTYLEMERDGRVVPLIKAYRQLILDGLGGWERKMNAVGAIDDTGIVTELYVQSGKLLPEFDHVLVDEIQDLGTLELSIIRSLTREGPNDLFLCGDAAQTVHTKHSDFKAARIDLPSARWIKLNQNYRNSRQILTAAHSVLTRSFDAIPKGTVDLEILPPEFANFTSPKPLLLKAESILEELAMSLAFIDEIHGEDKDRKSCIAVCGYSQVAIEALGTTLGLPVLSGNTDLTMGMVFLSDLEQTKGFEFDLMMVLNCCESVIPHPELPEQESFRELCKLYVALTRAKTQLVVSYHEQASHFIRVAEEHFNSAGWNEHVDSPKSMHDVFLPKPSLRQAGDPAALRVTGQVFLRMREAVGLSTSIQDELLQHVTGFIRTQGKAASRKNIEWKDFLSFYEDMETPRLRTGVISDVTWDELQGRLDPLLKNFGSNNGAVEEGRKAEQQLDDRPISLETPRAEKIEQRTPIHRRDDVLKFTTSELSAHTLASLLVSQGKRSVEELEIGLAMNYEVLGFLIPRRTLSEWLEKGRLRQMKNKSDSMALTRVGFEECKNRVVLNPTESSLPSPLELAPAEKIERYRKMILEGVEIGVPGRKFFRKYFVLNCPV